MNCNFAVGHCSCTTAINIDGSSSHLPALQIAFAELSYIWPTNTQGSLSLKHSVLYSVSCINSFYVARESKCRSRLMLNVGKHSVSPPVCASTYVHWSSCVRSQAQRNIGIMLLLAAEPRSTARLLFPAQCLCCHFLTLYSLVWDRRVLRIGTLFFLLLA